ncbi:hypothetical protein M9H77_09426 [Catharanthus roseus]|uniref:Uncharacterized protein n=1 Tax=Catharanthus roseus TaxID=4058 RepID=A0ACC0C0Z3_CATRO|nr:hypothetical protein M9H77_09426 [Catharanthus roseus]
MNQETSLIRSVETHWGSHYGTLINLIIIAEANGLLVLLQTFDFAFTLQLMKDVLAIINELSQALQRKDQDIINSMKLVDISKQRLERLRDNGWESLLGEVSSFCNTYAISIPNMEETFSSKQRYEHMLNDHITEANIEFVLCLACLVPDNSFSVFDKKKLIQFSKFYPSDFSSTDLVVLDNQLKTYILDMQYSDEFLVLRGICNLAEKLVESGKHHIYLLVYLLIKLTLTIPFATSTVERAFFAMKIVKHRLHNRMGDAWLDDLLGHLH